MIELTACYVLMAVAFAYILLAQYEQHDEIGLTWIIAPLWLPLYLLAVFSRAPVRAVVALHYQPKGEA